MESETHTDRAVLLLARSQHGLLTTAQAQLLGLGRTGITHRVRTGRWERIHRGIYLVGPLRSPFTDALAAVLACGPTAVLSHASAAALWELRPSHEGDVHVTVPGTNPPSRRGIQGHRSNLAPADRTRHHGVPVTGPARTLLDVLPTLPRPSAVRALDQAETHGLVNHRTLTGCLRRYPNHRGAGRLRQLLKEATGPALTRSEAERRLLDLIRAARLPPPRTNTRVAGYEVDFLWPEQRLVVEVDGYAFHRTRAAFERDRRKDADLLAAGYRVLRLTWRRLTRDAAAVVADIAGALVRVA